MLTDADTVVFPRPVIPNGQAAPPQPPSVSLIGSMSRLAFPRAPVDSPVPPRELRTTLDNFAAVPAVPVVPAGFPAFPDFPTAPDDFPALGEFPADPGALLDGPWPPGDFALTAVEPWLLPGDPRPLPDGVPAPSRDQVRRGPGRRGRGRRERDRRERGRRDTGRPGRRPDEGYTPTRRRTVVSRMALLIIVCLQAALSLRLRNTAFEDEALYLYAGRMELLHLLHGAPLQGDYASYFSGAPVLYPVLAAALNMLGGLALARGLSLAEMLAVTAMLYAITRRLFNERVALCAAALFAVTESAAFLGNFATFDATCLFLLACGTTIAVRWAGCRWPVFLLAAPVVAVAVAVKYAGLLYVPTIAVLAAIAGWPALGRRVLVYPLAFAAAVAGLLYGALRMAGPGYLAAVTRTTTARAMGGTAPLMILRESAEWGGLLLALALAGAVCYARRVRTEPGELIAAAGGPVRRTALGAVLGGTALLAPACQLHLHTDVSLHKHVGFGLFFAAPVAGLGLARLVGDHFRRPHVGIALWSAALVLGIAQASTLYYAWPPAAPLVRALAAHLEPGARYLVEVPEVPIYYLDGRPGAQPAQFWSTYDITFVTPAGRTLTGLPGFTAAVRAGYFRMIAYDNDVTPAADAAIARALRSARSYRLATVVRLEDSAGPVSYYVWVKRNARARR